MSEPSDKDPFDAVAAAAELAAALEDPGEAADTETDRDQVVRQLELDVADLSALVEAAEERARAAERRAEHAIAEVEAAKDRLRKDAARELERRTRAILLGFLDVLDDLDRALGSARALDPGSGVVRGLELVRDHFLAKLAEHGVRRIAALGERFDPGQHEGMTVVRVAAPAQDGTVVAVLREGYSIGDEVLRPAGVAVGGVA